MSGKPGNHALHHSHANAHAHAHSGASSSSTSNALSERPNMPLPSTPHAEHRLASGTVHNASGADSTRRGPELTAATKQGAPSFASVVSSSISASSHNIASTKSPISSIKHPQKQTQVHSPSSEDITNSTIDTSTQQATSFTEHSGDQETSLENSESSDIEIFIDGQSLQDSASRMHGFAGTGNVSFHSNHGQTSNNSNGASAQTRVTLADAAQQQSVSATSPSIPTAIGIQATNSNPAGSNSAKTLSPLPLTMPLSTSLSTQAHQKLQQKSQYGSSEISQSKSLQTPPSAPVHSTIPLPEMGEFDEARDADARQLENLHQHQQLQMYDQAERDVYGATIDLSGITLGGGGGDMRGHNESQRHALVMPTSQTLPVITTSFDSMSPGGSSPGSGFPTSSSDSGFGGSTQKTPNVYINGLPPHFPEDQLFALASPFGEIRSVRTFTRHVRDSESGYGFVLFETIEAAERCILSLRKYRNLHPTFSKQIHKIPGTAYANVSSSWDGQVSSGNSSIGELSPEASFKAKMESLHDPTSTNLYMEGLPLSIDEPTLAALVAPHRISSNRFFQTRLSNPPRIIAFVRLETRAGAEEVIERLHGRMVRGWNDPGSRISVRFADTSEQRELRRQERAALEGDNAPDRLTIAQAALLNLRGQELRPNSGSVIQTHGNGVSRIPSGPRGFTASVSAPDFSSNLANVPVIGTTGGRSAGLDVDYSHAPGHNTGGPSPRSRSPYSTIYQQYPQTSTVDPSMNALLDTLRGNGASYQGASLGYTDQTVEYDNYGQNRTGFGYGGYTLQSSRSLCDISSYARPAPAYARSGYTPTEEYIMRAHAETAISQAQVQQQQQQMQVHASERRRPAPLDLRRQRTEEELHDDSDSGANISVGVRGYRAQASIGRIGQGLISPAMTTGMIASSPMMSMSEDEFHNTSSAPDTAVTRNGLRSAPLRSFSATEGVAEMDKTVVSVGTRHNIHAALNARLSRESSTTFQVQRPPVPLSPSLTSPAATNTRDQGDAANDMINYNQHAAAHARSTTLPQHRSSVREGHHQRMSVRGHFQHSSMSMPAQNLRTPQHASVATLPGTRGIEGSGNGTIYENEAQQQPQQQQGVSNATNNDNGNGNGNGNARPHPKTVTHYSNSPLFSEVENMNAANSSPSLISPTLTYSSQTPSTMSPATPFFGSFNSQSEGFEKGSAGAMEHGVGKKVGGGGVLNPSGLRTLSTDGR